MNRKQKIIVSITGIFIVLLALVGLTYAYFLTRITGNENDKSISVTTANLELVYEDRDSSIIGEGKMLEPNSETPVGIKTFTVTNNGNETIESYAVIIENLAVKYVNSTDKVTAGEVTKMINGEDGNPDMKLVITCSSNKIGKKCNGMDGFLPEKSGILLTNAIETEEVQTYTAILTYLEDGTNQSDDMNKTIEGKFNIIDTKNTVDIEGTVTNYIKGDFVQINSEEKESVIYPDGSYKFVGVKPDNHKITVRYKENEVEKLRSNQEAQSLSIIKGNSAGILGNNITITDLSRTVKIDVDATTNSTIIRDVEEYNPFNKGTLAYNIYMNSAHNNNGTKLVSTPPSVVGEEVSLTNWEDAEEDVTLYHPYNVKAYWPTEEDLNNCFFNSPYDCSTQKDYTKCTTDLINKYLVITEASPYRAVKITGCTNSGIAKIETSNSEKILSITDDDDGKTYYYRGAVYDNYVNFEGMCWRIVRIEGDGGVKLVLEDKNTTCDSSTYTGDFIIDAGYYPTTNGVPDYINGTKNSSNSFNKKLQDWLTNTSGIDKDYLEYDSWCLGNLASSYTFNESLECTKQNYNSFDSYIALLNVDEVIYAGAKISSDISSNSNFYLVNTSMTSLEGDWATITLESSDSGYPIFTVGATSEYYGNLMPISGYGVESSADLRPAITLRKNIEISEGIGTLEEPYIIK